jgi:chromosome segregation ATPase
MKIHQLVLVLALALLGTVAALPELEGDEEDCPEVKMAREEEEEEAELQAELAALAEEAAEKGYPEQCMPHYDECIERINKYVANVENEIGMVTQRLIPTKQTGDDAVALTDELKVKIADQEKITEEAKKSEEMAKGDLEAAMKETVDAEQALASCNSSSESKIEALEANIAALQAEAAEFATSRFIFNAANIKSEAKGMLKKYGLFKDEL